MELIECEICNQKIPFSSYQKHVDDHLATIAKAQKQNQTIIQQTGPGNGSVVFTQNPAYKGQKPIQGQKGSDENEAQIPCEINAAKPKAKLLQQQRLVGNMILCDICNQQVLLKNIVKHLLKHDRKTPVECQYCGQVIQLKHYKTHTLFHELETRQSRSQPMECEHLYAHKLVDQMKMIQMGQQSKTQTSKPKNIGVFRKIANAFSTNAERKIQCKYCRDMPIMKIKYLELHNEERHKENPIQPCEKCKK
ncbi:MAG: hypothetical protein EZS28_023929, partial [Streblomastix strix]